jgi:hypothetical protein
LNAPDVGATLTVKVPELPGPTVTDDALVPSVKPPTDPDPPDPELLPHVRLVLTPLEILFVMLGFPKACTYSV